MQRTIVQRCMHVNACSYRVPDLMPGATSTVSMFVYGLKHTLKAKQHQMKVSACEQAMTGSPMCRLRSKATAAQDEAAAIMLAMDQGAELQAIKSELSVLRQKAASGAVTSANSLMLLEQHVHCSILAHRHLQVRILCQPDS